MSTSTPTLAKDEQIVALPTLVKRLPAPLRRFIGDLSDQEQIPAGSGPSQMLLANALNAPKAAVDRGVIPVT